MTGEARIHHWVPQCYLKGFAKSHSKKAQLNVIDISARKSFIANPRNIASARDFNRVSVKGIAANQIEEDYALFEGKLARALQWMWGQRQLGKDNDFNLLLNLIALLAVRNPRMRENVRDFHERVIKKMMHMTVDSEQMYESTFNRAAKDGYVDSDSTIDYLQMKDFIGGEKYSITMSTSGHVERELMLIDTVLPLLGGRHWMLMRASPDSGGFITSDHPVCLIWSEQHKRSLFDSPGFGLKGTEVVFPVSHDLAVVGTFEMQLGEIDLTLDQVALVNGIVIAHTERQVYSRDDKFFYTLANGRVHRGADLLRNLSHLPKKTRPPDVL